MKTVMDNEGLDVAGFEFVTDEAGRHYCYDINTNTNYNGDAEARFGIYAMDCLAEYLGKQLKGAYSETFEQAS